MHRVLHARLFFCIPPLAFALRGQFDLLLNNNTSSLQLVCLNKSVQLICSYKKEDFAFICLVCRDIFTLLYCVADKYQSFNDVKFKISQ